MKNILSIAIICIFCINSCTTKNLKNKLSTVKNTIDLFAPCSSSDLELFYQIQDGSKKALLKLIKKRGIDFHCNSEHGKSISSSVILSNNYDLINLYLNQKDVNHDIKDYITANFIFNDSVYKKEPNKLKIFKLCIKKGGRFRVSSGINDLSLMETAIKNGYDIYTTDSLGNNLIAEVAKENEFEGDIETLQVSIKNIEYFLEKGLDIEHKNKNGKNAIDLAKNKDLKLFLKSKIK